MKLSEADGVPRQGKPKMYKVINTLTERDRKRNAYFRDIIKPNTILYLYDKDYNGQTQPTILYFGQGNRYIYNFWMLKEHVVRIDTIKEGGELL